MSVPASTAIDYATSPPTPDGALLARIAELKEKREQLLAAAERARAKSRARSPSSPCPASSDGRSSAPEELDDDRLYAEPSDLSTRESLGSVASKGRSTARRSPSPPLASSGAPGGSAPSRAAFKHGELVRVKSSGIIGVVRYMGRMSCATGKWVGLEVPPRQGLNDGSVRGMRYFTVPPTRGLFVRPSAIEHVARRSPPAAAGGDKGAPPARRPRTKKRLRRATSSRASSRSAATAGPALSKAPPPAAPSGAPATQAWAEATPGSGAPREGGAVPLPIPSRLAIADPMTHATFTALRVRLFTALEERIADASAEEAFHEALEAYRAFLEDAAANADAPTFSPPAQTAPSTPCKCIPIPRDAPLPRPPPPPARPRRLTRPRPSPASKQHVYVCQLSTAPLGTYSGVFARGAALSTCSAPSLRSSPPRAAPAAQKALPSPARRSAPAPPALPRLFVALLVDAGADVAVGGGGGPDMIILEVQKDGSLWLRPWGPNGIPAGARGGVAGAFARRSAPQRDCNAQRNFAERLEAFLFPGLSSPDAAPTAPAALLSGYADTMLRAGDADAALEVHRRCLRHFEAFDGLMSEAVAAQCGAIGALHRRLGRPQEARSALSRCLNAFSASAGPLHASTAKAAAALAVLDAETNAPQAPQSLSRALQMLRAAEGVEASAVGLASNALGLLRLCRGDAPAAAEELRKAAAIAEGRPGGAAAAVENNLCVALLRAERAGAAGPRREALQRLREAAGALSGRQDERAGIVAAVVLCNCAHVELQRPQECSSEALERAAEMLKAALGVAEERLGKEHAFSGYLRVRMLAARQKSLDDSAAKPRPLRLPSSRPLMEALRRSRTFKTSRRHAGALSAPAKALSRPRPSPPGSMPAEDRREGRGAAAAAAYDENGRRVRAERPGAAPAPAPEAKGAPEAEKKASRHAVFDAAPPFHPLARKGAPRATRAAPRNGAARDGDAQERHSEERIVQRRPFEGSAGGGAGEEGGASDADAKEEAKA